MYAPTTAAMHLCMVLPPLRALTAAARALVSWLPSFPRVWSAATSAPARMQFWPNCSVEFQELPWAQGLGQFCPPQRQ